MNEDRKAGYSIGEIKFGIDQDTLDMKTIGFVREQLPEWRDDPDRSAEQSEDKLNLQLCKFLDSRARNAFPMVRFDHEEYQSDRRRVDLSASSVETIPIRARLHSIYDPILVFECKRLPAPSHDREKEYVTGGIQHKNGGIQRFKLRLHGADLDIAVMIGYLQQRSAIDWHREINGWISELSSGSIVDACAWNDTETLEPLDENVSKGISSCWSVHSRIGQMSSGQIRIHHLWIEMNKK